MKTIEQIRKEAWEFWLEYLKFKDIEKYTQIIGNTWVKDL